VNFKILLSELLGVALLLSQLHNNVKLECFHDEQEDDGDNIVGKCVHELHCGFSFPFVHACVCVCAHATLVGVFLMLLLVMYCVREQSMNLHLEFSCTLMECSMGLLFPLSCLAFVLVISVIVFITLIFVLVDTNSKNISLRSIGPGIRPNFALIWIDKNF